MLDTSVHETIGKDVEKAEIFLPAWSRSEALGHLHIGDDTVKHARTRPDDGIIFNVQRNRVRWCLGKIQDSVLRKLRAPDCRPLRESLF